MRPKLSRTVIVLSVVSFFNDLASDMVIPLLPILLTSVLAAGPAAVGLVEGVADALASFLKLWSGRKSDQLGGRRKMLTLVGYALSNLARPLLGLAGSWTQVLFLRSVDRIGKGIRSAPRDAMVADATPPQYAGYAFGFHRALDNAGAVGGALVAAATLAWTTLTVPQVLLWSCIPGLIGVLLIAFGVRDSERSASGGAPAKPSPLIWNSLSKELRRYLLLLVIFTFARTSETFLILRGQGLGMSVTHLLLLWAALNLCKSVAAHWGGGLADRIGNAQVLRISWSAYALSALGFALVPNPAALWIVTMVYGLFAGLSEGGERALISVYASANERGTAFGWYNMVLGLAAIPAGWLFGTIWQYQSAAIAYFCTALVALTALVGLQIWLNRYGSPILKSGEATLPNP